MTLINFDKSKIREALTKENIFELLSLADENICNLLLKFKGDIILEYISSLSFDELVTLEGSRIPEAFRAKVLEFSKDILRRHIDSLEKEDLYKYISEKYPEDYP